jgi:signal transduction histidine kinase/CheY-like chemotaxis protein
LAACIPIALFAAAVVFVLWRHQDAQLRAGRFQTAQAVAAAIQSEIDSTLFHLRYIATSPLIGPQHMAAFRVRCADAIRARSDWKNMVLVDRSGRQALNTLYADSSSRPSLGHLPHIRKSFQTGEATVSDLTSASDGRLLVSVSVPVVANAQVMYVLMVTMNLRWFDDLLRTHVPVGAAGLVDGQLRLISRSIEPDSYRGQHPVEPLTRRMRQAARGEMAMSTYEGIPVHGVWVDVPGLQWKIAIGYPDTLLGARLSWTILALVALGGVVLAGGLAVARHNSRRLQRAVEIVSEHAERLPTENDISIPRSNTVEIDILSEALCRTARRIREAEAERDRVLHLEQRARQIAEQTNRSKDEFLAVLGHELRNPLGAMSNAVTLLSPEISNPATRAYALGVLARQTAQLGRLIDDLLDVGRVVSGKVELQPQVVDLAELVHGAVDSLGVAGRTANHRIELDCQPVRVKGDPTRLEQVVLNLVNNAVNYSPDGSGISVSLHEKNGAAKLTVKDSGIGLSDEERRRVFDLFYQGTSHVKKGGLGVGLTLSKRIAELHGGTIDVVSPGKGLGTTFTLQLPTTESTAPVARGPQRAVDVEKMTIAVVDDNEDGRVSLATLLRNDGHTVHEFANGVDGLRGILELQPDVSIVDIGMPLMNGYEVAAKIRHAGRSDIRLIALTGYGQVEDVGNATQAGFNAHLVKPVDLNVLRGALKTHCARPRKRDPLPASRAG